MNEKLKRTGMRNSTLDFRNHLIRIKSAGLVLFSLVFMLLSSEIVHAGIRDSTRKATSTIGGGLNKIFANYMAAKGPVLLDVLIFFVVFFAVIRIALKKFGGDDNKNAVLALSVALSLMFTLALLYGAKLTVKKIFPFAIVILLIAIFGLLYFVLTKYVFRLDNSSSTGKKIALNIIAIFISIVICVLMVVFLIQVVCSSDSCSKIPIINKISSAVGSLKLGGSSSSTPSGDTKKVDSTVATSAQEDIFREARQYVDSSHKSEKDPLIVAINAQKHIDKVSILKTS